MRKTLKRKQIKRKQKSKKQRGGEILAKATNRASKMSLEMMLTVLQATDCSIPVGSGQYGYILKACTNMSGDCRPPCYMIKYTTYDGTPQSAIENMSLIHEIQIFSILAKAIKGTNIANYVEQYKMSVLPIDSTPWLVTEFIEGPTLNSVIPSNIQVELVALYFQALLVLNEIDKLVPGFVHGDLNPGNIFFIRRTTKLPRSDFEIALYDDDGNPTPIVVSFTGPYTIKLIDFGFSECDSYKWMDGTHPGHPSTRNGISGLWQLDAYMLLASFYDRATDDQKSVFQDIVNNYFSPTLVETLDNSEFDIYENMHLLDDFQPKVELFKRLNELI
jgi:serine/threonine protein kinase